MRLLISLLLLTVLTSSQCKFGDIKYAFDIKNNSSHPISYYVAGAGTEHVYPDTVLLTNKPPMTVILPGKPGSWYISYSFEKYFKELPRDTLSIFLFNADTLNTYDWTMIRTRYKVLQRYDLSLSDLQKRDFVITYP